MMPQPSVCFLLGLLALAQAALMPTSAVRPVPRVRQRATPPPLAAAPPVSGSSGSYGVGAGDWGPPAPEEQQQRAPRGPSNKAKQQRRNDGKHGRGRGRGRGGTSPVLYNVLRKMKALDSDATIDEVGKVLAVKKMSPRDYTTILTQLKQRRAWQLTLHVGEWLHLHAKALPNRAHYQVILGACAANGRAEEAQQLADQMLERGMPIDPTVLSTLVLAHERARAPQRAVELLDQLEAMAPPPAANRRASVSPEAEEAVAKAVAATEPSAREQAVAAAVDVFLSNLNSNEKKPSPKTAEDAGEAAAAEEIAAADPTAAAAAPSAPPSPALSPPSVDPLAFAYASAIRALDASGDWKGALKLYDRMENRGVSADAHCYSAALGACRRGAQAQRALGVLAAVRSEASDVAPNGVMYTLAMAACNAAGEWEESLALLEERRATDGPGVDAYGYSVGMAACAKGAAAERALNLLREMEADRECRGNAFAWNNAMVACNKGGKPEETLRLYERMRSGAAPLSEHGIAAALVACRGVSDRDGGGWQRAQAIFDGGAAEADASAMCYAALMDALSDGEQWELQLRYFDRLRAVGIEPSSSAYERAIEASDRVDPDRAMQLFDEMKEKGL